MIFFFRDFAFDARALLPLPMLRRDTAMMLPFERAHYVICHARI